MSDFPIEEDIVPRTDTLMRRHGYWMPVERYEALRDEITRLRDVIAGMETRRVMDERAHAEAVGELRQALDHQTARGDLLSRLLWRMEARR